MTACPTAVHDREPRKAPPGTYWRGPVLWGRVTVRGREHRFSLQTADSEEAKLRRDEEQRRLVDSAYFGASDLTEDLAKTTWRRGREIGFVYFVEADGFVKIGFAKEWRGRLAALQTANRHKLKRLAVVSGSRKEEHQLHRQFARFRRRGEWFSVSPELLTYIDLAKRLGRCLTQREFEQSSIDL